ncbi:MAG: glycosyltransferase family 4 protein [Ignavibacteria bacterium]
MKICFATYEGVPLGRGGPFIKIIETKKELEKLGHSVELFNMWNTADRLTEFDIIHLVGSNFSIYGFARNLHFRKINFIVEPVFYSNHGKMFLKTASIAGSITKKFIPGLWLDYEFIKDICSWSELITPNTSSEKELISGAFNIPSEKFKIIPNGVSKRFLNPDPSLFIKEYGIKDFILNVGHIGPERKNILNLVKALQEINQPAVIIGKMLNAGETREINKIAGRNKNLLFIEELPNDSPVLASAYAACDTFVLPSMFETPGIAALEASLAGAKIVITPYGGTKEYFKDMAEYVEPDSVNSIKEGIIKSLNSKKSEGLKQFIKENFLWETVAQKILEIYKKCV